MIDPFISHLDDLKERRDLSDAELADIVGLPNRQYLSKIRRGEKDIPTEVKLQVWNPVSYTHLRAHETVLDLVCRLLLEKKKKNQQNKKQKKKKTEL